MAKWNEVEIEVMKRGGRGKPPSPPGVTISKKQMILTKAAFEAIGKPESIKLLTGDNGQFAVVVNTKEEAKGKMSLSKTGSMSPGEGLRRLLNITKEYAFIPLKSETVASYGKGLVGDINSIVEREPKKRGKKNKTVEMSD